MAARCASSRRSEMPCGHIKTGRAMPKIPGSREVRDKKISIRFGIPAIRSSQRSASTSRPSRKGTAFRIAAEIRRQRRYQTKTTTRNPESHATVRTAGSRWVKFEETVAGVARNIMDIVGCVNGWLTSSIAKYKPAFVPAELRDHGRWLPMATSNENGIRNFTDAASHSQ